jgi:magnesium-transporting ATPase (P-type)
VHAVPVYADGAGGYAGWDTTSPLATSAGKGLDTSEAAARLQKYGPNRLPEGKKRGPLKRFLAQFNNILVYVLLAAGFTKLMLNFWIDAGHSRR